MPARASRTSSERSDRASRALKAALVVLAIAAFAFALGHWPSAPTEAPREITIRSRAPERDPAPERLRVRVVRTYPHAPDAFTQGLLWHDGFLYESTGLYGESSLRKVALETGVVLERRDLERNIFAEGLALVGNELVQLSWQEHIAHVFSVDSFRSLRTFDYEGEGWGLCFDGNHLVMSDGSDRLFFRDPRTFEIARPELEVRMSGAPVHRLNELECVGDVIWANVWETDQIVRIDARTGRVTAVALMHGLLTPEERRDADVLNGIAYSPERGHFLVTGKLWPRIFEIELLPERDAHN